MTIFEITRYVPLGSEVVLFEWDQTRSMPDPKKQHSGILAALMYEKDRAGHVAVLRQGGEEKRYPVGKIAHIKIEKQPEDYDLSTEGVGIDSAAWAMFSTVREYMKFITPSKRQELELVFQTELPEETEQMHRALKEAGLDKAAELVKKWRHCSYDQWQELFRELYAARLAAEECRDPDVYWLRRAEAYICCRARKENQFIYDQEYIDPIAYAINLLRQNLLENEVQMLDETEYGAVTARKDVALDWMLLALCYHRSGMHGSCAYAALVQCGLNLGYLFRDRKNLQMFIHLCANAHDFTYLRSVLEHENCERNMETLTAIGKCICWMMYQMGGSGILDAAELLVSVEGCTEATLSQLRQRALAYTYKYMPRNRNDRYMAITDAMGRLLKRQEQEHPDPECRFGYLYEFHGGRDLPVGYYDGFILGEDFLCYRISYPADSYHRLPLMIQAKSAQSRETGERAVFGVWFYPSPSGLLYRYQADSDIEFEHGGMFDL